MLTVEELKAGKSAYDRWSLLLFGVAFLPVLGCLGAVTWYDKFVRGPAPRTYNEAISDLLWLLAASVVGLGLFFGASWIRGRWLKHDARVNCPYCGRLLVSIKDLVIATRNCGHCGRRILPKTEEPVTGLASVAHEPSEKAPGWNLLTAEALRAGFRAEVRRYLLWSAALVIAFVFGVIGSKLFAIATFRLQQFAIIPFLVIFCWAMASEWWRTRRDARLRCPRCRKRFHGMTSLVIATRNCVYCGRRVVAEPDEPGPSLSPPAPQRLL